MTYINDFSHALEMASTLRPQTVTSNTNGVSVDTSALGANQLSAFLTVGAVSGTSPTLDVKLQASTTGTGGWADIPDAVFDQVTTANQTEVIRLVLPRADDTTANVSRYIRAVATVGGTSPSFALAVVIMGTKKHPTPSEGTQAAPPSIN